MTNTKVFLLSVTHSRARAVFPLIDQALSSLGVTLISVGEDPAAGASFYGNVRAAIDGADVIICDLSMTDHLVLHNLGYAFGLKKPVVLIAATGAYLPLDLRSFAVIRYELDSRQEPNPFLDTIGTAIGAAIANPAVYSGEVSTSEPTRQVFISYSHADAAFLRRLLVHLRPLERSGAIDLWADTKLTAGGQWKAELQRAVKRARVAVLLISADFLASDFIAENEPPPLLLRAATDGTLIIPVVLTPCRFLREPGLARFQAINDPSRPLITLGPGGQEEVYDSVARVVEDAVNA